MKLVIIPELQNCVIPIEQIILLGGTGFGIGIAVDAFIVGNDANGGKDVVVGSGGNVIPPGNVNTVEPVGGNGGNVIPPGNVGRSCLATRLKLQEQTKDIKIRTLK